MLLKRQRAFIVEEDCIGCSRCVDYCPVACIIGAPKQLHNVLAQECIGCTLCVQPCPVDCIIMVEVDMSVEQAHDLGVIAKQRYGEKARRTQQEQQLLLSYVSKEQEAALLRAEIALAVERGANKPNGFKIYGKNE